MVAVCLRQRTFGSWSWQPRESEIFEQQEALTATYPSLDELKAELKARGLPIDHLEDPKLIELEPSDE